MALLHGDKYGLHRVISPPSAMPQAAWRISNEMVCYDNEILLDVETLNIDSASFRQIKEEADGDVQQIGDIMQRIVADRGKHHNPVTSSGGMLVGCIREVGSVIAARGDVQVGDRVATLVSLSLTPLTIERIVRVDVSNDQVDIVGQAVLFESGIFAHMPTDLPDRVALSVFDVCGAPAQTARLVQLAQRVVVLGGGGKSGMLVLAAARRAAGVDGRVVAVEYGDAACRRVADLGFADAVLNLDATQPGAVYAAVSAALQGELADVVINCVNVSNTEMASILCCREGGIVYFFSMATSFTQAALGAEGVGKDVQLMIGNGYCRGHAAYALQLLRETPALLDVFAAKFA